MPRNEHRARQKRRRAAHANQQLAQHQPAVVWRHGRQGGPGDGQRKGAQHRAAQPIQVHANAHKELHDAKGQPKQPGKCAQRRRGQTEVALQPACHDGRDGAVRLAERERRQQRQQHGPEGASCWQVRLLWLWLWLWLLFHGRSSALHAMACRLIFEGGGCGRRWGRGHCGYFLTTHRLYIGWSADSLSPAGHSLFNSCKRKLCVR